LFLLALPDAGFAHAKPLSDVEVFLGRQNLRRQHNFQRSYEGQEPSEYLSFKLLNFAGFVSASVRLRRLRLSRFAYCGEAGKIRDLMTTGTDPEDGISVPISIKSKSLSAMPSIEITGFCILSSS